MTQEEVNATWSGYFAFTNQLGQDITSGTANHKTVDFGTQSIDLGGLGNGQTFISKAFVTSTFNFDQ